jgi:hypothetical protein
MTLPVINTPKYELTLPGSGKKISYRPFLVKEEKILMMASESEDPKTMELAVGQIVDACVDGGLDIKELPTFDVEYLFVNLRGKSVGETVDLKVQCEKCKHEVTKRVDVTEVKVVEDKKAELKIPITDSIGIVMKYPSYGEISQADADKDPLSVINTCIDYIYDDQQVYKADECSKEELDQFVESLNHAQLMKLQEFFTTMPRLEKDISWKCEKCEHKNKQKITGMASFFA